MCFFSCNSMPRWLFSPALSESQNLNFKKKTLDLYFDDFLFNNFSFLVCTIDCSRRICATTAVRPYIFPCKNRKRTHFVNGIHGIETLYMAPIKRQTLLRFFRVNISWNFSKQFYENIFGQLLNPLMPGDNKRSYIFKQTCS